MASNKNEVIETLVHRDGFSLEEAQEQLAEARERVAAGEDPETVLREEFGLEPDYIYDLI
jgi:hypothetical protein